MRFHCLYATILVSLTPACKTTSNRPDQSEAKESESGELLPIKKWDCGAKKFVGRQFFGIDANTKTRTDESLTFLEVSTGNSITVDLVLAQGSKRVEATVAPANDKQSPCTVQMPDLKFQLNAAGDYLVRQSDSASFTYLAPDVAATFAPDRKVITDCKPDAFANAQFVADSVQEPEQIAFASGGKDQEIEGMIDRPEKEPIRGNFKVLPINSPNGATWCALVLPQGGGAPLNFKVSSAGDALVRSDTGRRYFLK